MPPRLLAPLLLACFLPAAPALPGEPIRILADGRVHAVRGAVGTVAEAIATAGVRLDAGDRVEPDRHAPIPEDGVIRVVRVRIEERVETRVISYRTIVRPATGARRPYHPTVVQEGRTGLARTTERLRLEDGKIVERAVVATETVREPRHEIVLSRNPAALGARGAYAGKRSLLVEATAYDPGTGSCGRFADGRTADGRRAGYGIIAVDPHVIPLGTRIHVPGYGYGIAADVGSAIRGNRIDLGYNSREGARAWGRKQVRITILD